MGKKIKYAIITFVVILLMFIATFNDLDIAKSVYNEDMVWAHIFKIVGEFPIYLGLLIFGITYFHLASKKTLKNILLTEIFASTFLLIFMPFRYLVKLNILSVGIITLLSIVLFFLLMKWSYRINKEKYEKIKTVSLICFVGVMTQLCVIYLMKLMWSRVRFFELDENYTSFTRWFVINWFEGKGTSFPSGHTSGATNIMYLTLFTPLFTEDKKKHWFVEGFCFLFITLTAFSRMVLGKHYLSDVTMAFAITYVIHIIVSKSIIDRQKKKKSI